MLTYLIDMNYDSRYWNSTSTLDIECPGIYAVFDKPMMVNYPDNYNSTWEI